MASLADDQTIPFGIGPAGQERWKASGPEQKAVYREAIDRALGMAIGQLNFADVNSTLSQEKVMKAMNRVTQVVLQGNTNPEQALLQAIGSL